LFHDSLTIHPSWCTAGCLLLEGPARRVLASQNKQKKLDNFFLKNKNKNIYNKGLAISIKKYLKAKEELWILKYFTMQKNY
jgi:hypothetical protein